MTPTGRQVRKNTPSLGLIEMHDGVPSISEGHAATIHDAVESAGVIFTPENGGGAGVRLRRGEP